MACWLVMRTYSRDDGAEVPLHQVDCRTRLTSLNTVSTTSIRQKLIMLNIPTNGSINHAGRSQPCSCPRAVGFGGFSNLVDFLARR